MPYLNAQDKVGDPSLLLLAFSCNVHHRTRRCRPMDSGPASSSPNGMIPRWFLGGTLAGLRPRCPQQPPAQECTPHWLFSLLCLTFSSPPLVLHGITLQINRLRPISGSVLEEHTYTELPPRLTSYLFIPLVTAGFAVTSLFHS